MHRYRTRYCGSLRREDIGSDVRISGWIHRKRDLGSLIFVDLRDNSGIVQLTYDSEHKDYELIRNLSRESVISVTGRVIEREPSTVNPNLPTGEVEVIVNGTEVLSRAEQLPFPVADAAEIPENLRLTYRFLDLRRQQMHDRILLRSRVINSIRRRMIDMGFYEFHTPILTSSSPEGARDYLVPSRRYPGKFYALPQAPQQFKQLLMVAGFDRYFQIAPCFRDEDARADRSPGEFYQLDVEMSFVEQDDVFTAMETLFTGLFPEFSNWAITPAPFPRIRYRDSLLKYGVDKPDLRFGLEIQDVSDVFRESKFRIFRSVVDKKGVVRMIALPQGGSKSRAFFDGLEKFIRDQGGKGLAHLTFKESGPSGSIASALEPQIIERLREISAAEEGTTLLLVADQEPAAAALLGKLRVYLADELSLRKQNSYEFCWITDFPMYEFDEETKSVQFSHNPFSMPQGGLQALETMPPLDILAYQYDLVCNGVELSSGAIRNHSPEIMYKAFSIAGYPPEEVDRRFGGMIRAFRYGAPPHGGLAPGIERIVMLLAQEKNIREIIPFPLNQNAQDLLMGAPSEVQPKQLQELHLKIVPPKGSGQPNPGTANSEPSQPEPPKGNEPGPKQEKKEPAKAI